MKKTLLFVIALIAVVSVSIEAQTEIRRVYWDNGQLRSWVTFEDGVQSGPYEIYFPNGQLVQKSSWAIINGERTWDGLRETYYQNGQPQTIQYYRNGVLDGPHITYNEDGSMRARRTYNMGERCGVWSLYYQDETRTYDPC